MAQATVTVPLDPSEAGRVRTDLEAAGFELGEAPYAFFRAKSTGCTVTFYNKGKVVLQGPRLEEWLPVVAPDYVEEEEEHPFDGALAKHPTPPPARWIGIDEAGKGDFFGPLVVVAAAVDRDRVELLRELGVGDSKRIADGRIKKLAGELRHICRVSKLVLRPEKYNQLYAKIGNLNRLLAWGHARVLENLLEEDPSIEYALSDKFARDDRTVQRALMERGRQIQLDQRTKAEADPAVAVASIFARAEFVWQMDALSREAGVTLRKGAGPPVLAAGRQLVAEAGADVLPRFAKMHFATAQQIV